MIVRKYEEDPADAAAEYGGEFRSDLEAYVGIEGRGFGALESVRQHDPWSSRVKSPCAHETRRGVRAACLD